MHRRLLTALGASLLLLAAILPAPAPAQPVTTGPQFTKAGIFIVQMRELPSSRTTAAIKGLTATKPRHGQKIDPTVPW